MSVFTQAFHDTLQRHWPGYTLRPLQSQIIEAVLQKRDCLALMPTGGGKSLCYQLPALMLDGVCVVVSPLVALMQDQVNQLRAKNIAADFIHAGMWRRDIDRVFSNAVHGHLKLLYLSPERLESEQTQYQLAGVNISFIAVDEAHCISQWGHDFRPSYLKIAEIQKYSRHHSFLALTATATPRVCDEIISNLQMANPIRVQSSFERKNISILVRYEDDKYDACLHILKKLQSPAIVYTRSRFKTQELTSYLTKGGVPAIYYHAGLPYAEREKRQNLWMKMDPMVMVCTSAFGMGIDKRDVRMVLHVEPCSNIEQYYQEIGRAGRDGKNAYAVLLYNRNDLRQFELSADDQFPSMELIRQIYRDLAVYAELPEGEVMESSVDFKIEQFCQRFNYPIRQALAAIRILQQQGWLQVIPSVYVPPKLMITASENDLSYVYESGSRQASLLDFILRNMENVFTFPVPIPVERLELVSGMAYEEWHNQLKIWQSEGLVEYYPQKDQAQLYFLTRRQQKEHVHINARAYEQRKSLALAQTKAMIDLLETDDCKQKIILNYFGESSNENCGRCNFCRAQSEISDEQMLQTEKQIMQFLNEHRQLTMRRLVQMFPFDRGKCVQLVLEDLIDRGVVLRKFDTIYLKNLGDAS